MSDELFNNPVTSQYLSEQLQDQYPQRSPQQWEGWLQNNRNQSRKVPYRIPFERIAGGVFYSKVEIDKFIESEKQRRAGSIKNSGRVAEIMRAYGIDEGGTSKGRVWKGLSAYTSNDEGEVYIQLTIKEPWLVYRLTPEQARSAAKELMEVGEAGMRQSTRNDE